MEEYAHETVRFYDKFADEFQKNTQELQDTAQLEKFISHLPVHAHILDIGCAYGRDCTLFAAKGFKAFGVDLSERMIEKSKALCHDAQFRVMDARKLDFRDGTFQGVCCSQTLLHLTKQDALRALKEIHRVLAKSGVFYLALKEGDGEGLVEDRRYKGARKYYAYYGKEELRTALEDAGFEIISMEVQQFADKYRDKGIIFTLARKKVLLS